MERKEIRDPGATFCPAMDEEEAAVVSQNGHGSISPLPGRMSCGGVQTPVGSVVVVR